MLRAGFLALSVLACASPVHAADLSPLRAMEVSRQLYEAGMAARDPLLVAAAAQLRKGVAPRGPEEGAPLTWQAMLDEAGALAGEDAAMLSVIDDTRAAASKGVATGPVYRISELGAQQTDTYSAMPFEGGAYAEVYVEGAGDADLDLHVHDAEGQLVCADTDPHEVAYCGWRPAHSAEFTVTVSNKGAGTSRYALMTN